MQPWIKAGYQAVIADILHEADAEAGGLVKISGDLRKQESRIVGMLQGLPIHLLCSFPPCTDMSVSGAKHFAAKRAADPSFEDKALELVWIGVRMGNALGCPYFIENPVSTLSSFWRKPDFTFNPFDYGGYLPEGDLHPQWPDHIPPRDSYSKLTCIWGGNDFVMPKKKPVPQFVAGWAPQVTSLGGKGLKTKIIRSATPRGFSQALFEHYSDK